MKKRYFVYIALAVLPCAPAPATSSAATVAHTEIKSPNILVIKTKQLNDRLKEIAK